MCGCVCSQNLKLIPPSTHSLFHSTLAYTFIAIAIALPTSALKPISTLFSFMRISILELQNPSSSSSSSWMLLYLTNQFCVFHVSLVSVVFVECTISLTQCLLFCCCFALFYFFHLSFLPVRLHFIGLFFCHLPFLFPQQYPIQFYMFVSV